MLRFFALALFEFAETAKCKVADVCRRVQQDNAVVIFCIHPNKCSQYYLFAVFWLPEACDERPHYGLAVFELRFQLDLDETKVTVPIFDFEARKLVLEFRSVAHARARILAGQAVARSARKSISCSFDFLRRHLPFRAIPARACRRGHQRQCGNTAGSDGAVVHG